MTMPSSAAMSNVVPLRPTGYLFADAWAVMPASMKKRSMSREKLLPIWRDHAKRVGEEALLGALRAYVADEDCRKWGGVALDRWLKHGRYDHYLEDAAADSPSNAARGLEKIPVWPQLVEALGEPFCKSYIMPYEWDAEGSRLIVPRTRLTAIDKLKEQASKLKACGVMGIKLSDA